MTWPGGSFQHLFPVAVVIASALAAPGWRDTFQCHWPRGGRRRSDAQERSWNPNGAEAEEPLRVGPPGESGRRWNWPLEFRARRFCVTMSEFCCWFLVSVDFCWLVWIWTHYISGGGHWMKYDEMLNRCGPISCELRKVVLGWRWHQGVFCCGCGAQLSFYSWPGKLTEGPGWRLVGQHQNSRYPMCFLSLLQFINHHY